MNKEAAIEAARDKARLKSWEGGEYIAVNNVRNTDCDTAHWGWIRGFNEGFTAASAEREEIEQDRDKWLAIAQRLFKQRQILVHGHDYEDKYDNEILKAIREHDQWPDLIGVTKGETKLICANCGHEKHPPRRCNGVFSKKKQNGAIWSGTCGCESFTAKPDSGVTHQPADSGEDCCRCRHNIGYHQPFANSDETAGCSAGGCRCAVYNPEPPSSPDGLVEQASEVKAWEMLAYFEMSGNHWRDRDTVRFAIEFAAQAIAADRITHLDLRTQLAYEAGRKAGEADRIKRAKTCELCGGLSQNHLATDPLNLDHKFKRAEERVCKWQWLEELDGLFLRECGYTSAMKTPFCPNCGGKVVEIKDGEL